MVVIFMPSFTFPLYTSAVFAIKHSVNQIPVSLLHLILTLLVVAAIISIIIYFFSVKLKRANFELLTKSTQIGDINKTLEETNRHLSFQKEEIAKELSNSETFFRTLIQSAEDGISFYDIDWNLKFANNAFYSVLGVDSVRYNNTDPFDFIHPDDTGYPEKRLEALKTKGYFESELRLKHIDGHYINFSTKSLVIKDNNGSVIGSLTISRDITALKKFNEDLIQAKVEADTSNKLKHKFSCKYFT